jgi:hypothetical protein
MIAPDPTTDQIESLVRLAADLPLTDVARQAYEIQAAGIDTPGAQLLRRMIAEILALRVTVRRMNRGN